MSTAFECRQFGCQGFCGGWNETYRQSGLDATSVYVMERSEACADRAVQIEEGGDEFDGCPMNSVQAESPRTFTIEEKLGDTFAGYFIKQALEEERSVRYAS